MFCKIFALLFAFSLDEGHFTGAYYVAALHSLLPSQPALIISKDIPS